MTPDRRIYIEICNNGFIVEELKWDSEKDCWRPTEPHMARRVFQDDEITLDAVKEWMNE